MAENIGGSNLFSSGNHAWHWGGEPVGAKEFQAVGTTGAARIVLGVGPQPCLIAGGDGTPAVLMATGNTKALADAALDALETAIEALKRSGTEKTWEDDAARTGSHLVILDYRRQGPRRYSRTAAGAWKVWQFYFADLAELAAAGA
jgi:hypothetical protein